jgi:hypothetical protein
MSKKCIPGVICIENVTIVFIVVIIIGLFLLLNYKAQRNNRGLYNINNERGYDSAHNIGQHNRIRNNTYLPENMPTREPMPMRDPILMREMPIFSEDVLLNPYDAPLRDDRYSQNLGRFIPINVPTQSIDTNYRQVGILTRIKGKETILPLMGRPLFTNRDKWNFYTMNDSNNVVKLPITFKGRSCTSEYGCDNLYGGDIVFVEGYNDAFRVTAYDSQVMRYIPFM